MRWSHRIAFAAAAASFISLRPTLAQGTIAGNWIVEYDRRVSNVNGEVTTSEKARARIVFEQRGDSALGVWHVISAGGDPPSGPRHLRGVVSGKTVHLISDPTDAIMRRDGAESHVAITTRYDLTLGGDSLTGSQQATGPDGDALGGARPFIATRERP